MNDKFEKVLERRRAEAAALLSRVADAYAAWMDKEEDSKPSQAVLKHLRAGRLTNISPQHWYAIREGIKANMDIDGDQGAKEMYVFALVLTKYDTIGLIHDAGTEAGLSPPRNA